MACIYEIDGIKFKDINSLKEYLAKPDMIHKLYSNGASPSLVKAVNDMSISMGNTETKTTNNKQTNAKRNESPQMRGESKQNKTEGTVDSNLPKVNEAGVQDGKENKVEYESVKIKKSIVDRVRANKVITGVPVSVFFEMAAEDRLPVKSIAVLSEYASSMSPVLVEAIHSANKKKK